MGIKGLTDIVRPAFPTIGKLRKGGPAIKDKDGKTVRMGPDLEYFRFTSERPEIEAKFHEAYGDKPTLINAYMPYPGVAEAFDTCKEEWSAGGLKHRCDGETVCLWLGSDGKYHTTPMACKGGCDEVGRLSLIIPELVRAGFVGFVALETHGLHDLMSIQASLMAACDARLGNPLGLRGIPWIIRRVKQMVSTPGPNGKRIRREKWLVKIEPCADWVQLQIQTEHNATMLLPAGRPLPTDDDTIEIDRETGEIIDTTAREVEATPAAQPVTAATPTVEAFPAKAPPAPTPSAPQAPVLFEGPVPADVVSAGEKAETAYRIWMARLHKVTDGAALKVVWETIFRVQNELGDVVFQALAGEKDLLKEDLAARAKREAAV
ncbi:MAG: hypothetical protein V2A73_02970 [Pseudomonadota bacterium]